VTKPARITQADMERATKAVANAGLQAGRIIMDFANQRIEVIIGEPEAAPAQADPQEVWPDDDV
jgi:hypothetical protein